MTTTQLLIAGGVLAFLLLLLLVIRAARGLVRYYFRQKAASQPFYVPSLDDVMADRVLPHRGAPDWTDVRNAPPQFGGEFPHKYVAHETLACCKYCGGGELNPIHESAAAHPSIAQREADDRARLAIAEAAGAGELAPGAPVDRPGVCSKCGAFVSAGEAHLPACPMRTFDPVRR